MKMFLEKHLKIPKRRTPGIDKIIEFTGIKPTKNIDFMIENIIDFKKIINKSEYSYNNWNISSRCWRSSKICSS